MRKTFRGVAGVVVFLVIWELFSRSGAVAQEYFPPASTVLLRFVQLLGDQMFLLDLVATVLAWAIALGLSIVIAVPLGLLLGSMPLVRAVTRSIIEFLRPIAPAAVVQPGVQRVPERPRETEPRGAGQRDVRGRLQLHLERHVLDDPDGHHPDALLETKVGDGLRGTE